MQVGFGMLTSCVKVTATQKSYIIINIFECIQAGGIPITNEVDCPLLEKTGKFEVVSPVYILGSISVIHACDSSCTFTFNQQTTIEREEVAVKYFRTVKHNYNNSMYFINLYCTNHYSTVTI